MNEHKTAMTFPQKNDDSGKFSFLAFYLGIGSNTNFESIALGSFRLIACSTASRMGVSIGSPLNFLQRIKKEVFLRYRKTSDLQ
jgi:hypothetical protein